MISVHHRALASVAPHLLTDTFQRELGGVYASYLAAFDIMGRAHVLQDARKKTGKQFRASTTVSFADELGFENVPFTAAIDRIIKLIGIKRDAFDGLAKKYQKQAFTISGISDLKLIQQIKSALADVLESGGTADDFRAAVDELTDEAGIDRLSQVQIDTVFQTNVMTAYGNGRYEQMTDPDVAAVLPYWVLRTAGDDRVRLSHAVLNGFAARNDDPVWNRLYPPLGYNCRCLVTAEGPDDVDKEADTPGLRRIPPAAAGVPDDGFGGEPEE
ncbi:MAG TPA: phage minor head protein [Candidatus Angelobacter sp.]|nr:phage minor head protein [Candidatus Angelobacter sp.]